LIDKRARVCGHWSLQALMSQYDASYVADMSFLGTHVWPRVQSVAFCHDSFSCDRFNASHAFPVPRHGAEHVGAVYNELSVCRQVDMDILTRAGVNRKCVPPGWRPASHVHVIHLRSKR